MTDEKDSKDFIETMHEYANKDFLGYNVPCSDVLIQKTTPYVALVFGKIWLFSRGINKYTEQKKGYCYASIGTIAKQLGLSENTVKDSLKILQGEEYIGSGKSKRKNIYFNKETRLILDVTPKEFLSKRQVRFYGILYHNFEKYIKKWEIKKETKNEITPEMEEDIYSMILDADSNQDIMDVSSGDYDYLSEYYDNLSVITDNPSEDYKKASVDSSYSSGNAYKEYKKNILEKSNSDNIEKNKIINNEHILKTQEKASCVFEPNLLTIEQLKNKIQNLYKSLPQEKKNQAKEKYDWIGKDLSEKTIDELNFMYTSLISI